LKVSPEHGFGGGTEKRNIRVHKPSTLAFQFNLLQVAREHGIDPRGEIVGDQLDSTSENNQGRDEFLQRFGRILAAIGHGKQIGNTMFPDFTFASGQAERARGLSGHHGVDFRGG
jgi:hypothetical protein